MRALWGFVVVLAAVFATGGCGGVSVKTSAASDADLRQYRTYAWFPKHVVPGQVESLAQQDVRASLEKALAQKGLRLAGPGQAPDFLVAYNAKLSDSPSVDWGYGNDYGPPPEIEKFDRGTLFVDFIDPKSRRVIWRGKASNAVENPEVPDAAKIDQAVSKLLNEYPAQMASASRPRS